MTSLLKNQLQSIKTMNVFKNSFATMGIHILAAMFFGLIARSVTETAELLNWGTILVAAILLGTLTQTMFLRKHLEEDTKFRKWETMQAIASALISGVFAFCYANIITTANASMWPMIALALVMHMACTIITSVGSKKLMLATCLPMSIAVFSALLLHNQPLSLLLAASIFTFTLLILVVGFTAHSALIDGYEMHVMYEEQVNEAEAYKSKFQKSTIKDPQTQVFNRRFFDLMINEEIRRAKRAGTSFSLAIIQIDCFEEYAQHFGNEKGLTCLRRIAKLMTDATPRGGEFLTRFDNDKFALLLPNIDTQHAIAFAAKMHYLVGAENIQHPASSVDDIDTLTVSIGVSEFTPNNIIDVKRIIEQALSGLKTAVSAGGNNTKTFAANIVPDPSIKMHDNNDEVSTVEIESLPEINAQVSAA